MMYRLWLLSHNNLTSKETIICGIVGIIADKRLTGFTFKHKKAFSDMLHVCSIRGEDSTGMFYVNKYGNAEFAKEASISNWFLDRKEVQDILTDVAYKGVLAVGHNRSATRGKVSDINAHPFVENNIILVHNGTLTNQKELHATAEVDSHAITHSISEIGIVATISKMQGAFAIACYDVSQRVFHLARNKERPLWIAKMIDGGWAFASEPWMIHGLLWRNEIKYETATQLEPGKMYTFDLEQDNITMEEEEVELWKYKQPDNWKPITTVVTASATMLPVVYDMSSLDVTDICKRYSKGSLICFKPSRLDGPTRLKGTHNTSTKIKIHCTMEPDTTFDEARVYLGMNEVVAEVVAIHANSSQNEVNIYCNNPAISIPLVTVNGTLLNEEMVELLPATCTECKKEMEEELLIDSYVRIHKKVNKIRLICPCCVDKNLKDNQNWGGILYASQQISA